MVLEWTDLVEQGWFLFLYLALIPIGGVFIRKLSLARSARRLGRSRISMDDSCQSPSSWPRVCVQLPIFNEPSQVKDLLTAISQLQWPYDRLEVQILDDSVDHTPQLVQEALDEIAQVRPQLQFFHIRRNVREGYKAGALNCGLSQSEAQYFAIFDADFRPEADFLKRLVFRLEDNVRAAFVQSIWSYVNERSSIFARMQSNLLNTHFCIEHAGRFASGYPFNFNGTAGIWRREALEQLGGWSDHSVTEDLYLSYAAHLEGWSGILAPDVQCDSLLPDDLPSFLIQQRRWAKGSGQVLRLIGGKILRTRSWPLSIRMDALAHLLGYAITSLVPIVFGLAFFWVESRAEWIQNTNWWDPTRLMDSLFWITIWALIFGVYASKEAHTVNSKSATSQTPSLPHRVLRTVFLLLASPFLGVFLIPSFWRGVLIRGSRSELVFNRTPKRMGAYARLNREDHILALFTIGVFVSLANEALTAGLPFLSALFVAHSLCGLWIWLNALEVRVPLKGFAFVRKVAEKSRESGDNAAQYF